MITGHKNLPHLITRAHTALDGTRSTAVYSPCLRYRYFLERRWKDGPALVFLMLNPSTATEQANDPTVARCERRARMGGYGALQVLNIFAFRATDPNDMRAAADPVGPDNNFFLRIAIAENAHTARLICGWGTHGAFKDREAEVFKMFLAYNSVPLALQWTKNGHPQHPLYVGYDAQPCMKERIQATA